MSDVDEVQDTDTETDETSDLVSRYPLQLGT